MASDPGVYTQKMAEVEMAMLAVMTIFIHGIQMAPKSSKWHPIGSIPSHGMFQMVGIVAIQVTAGSDSSPSEDGRSVRNGKDQTQLLHSYFPSNFDVYTLSCSHCLLSELARVPVGKQLKEIGTYRMTELQSGQHSRSI